jgi:SAM-dependent methyltransferase
MVPSHDYDDRSYFDHWYRGAGLGLGDPEYLDRKVRLAVGAAEYLLDRPIEAVLDVGCGEAPWRAALRKARPGVRYVGVDPSAYVAQRYGRTRSVVQGSLSQLASLDLVARNDGAPYDLVVCADVLQVAPDVEVRAGLDAIANLLGGIAFIEVFTGADSIVGDLGSFRPRRPSTYDRWFAAAGLARVGPHLYAGERIWPRLSAFERG